MDPAQQAGLRVTLRLFGSGDAVSIGEVRRQLSEHGVAVDDDVLWVANPLSKSGLTHVIATDEAALARVLDTPALADKLQRSARTPAPQPRVSARNSAAAPAAPAASVATPGSRLKARVEEATQLSSLGQALKAAVPSELEALAAPIVASLMKAVEAELSRRLPCSQPAAMQPGPAFMPALGMPPGMPPGPPPSGWPSCYPGPVYWRF